MIAIEGYYDGQKIMPIEKVDLKLNQKVLITILDEFVEPEQALCKNDLRGIFAEYANPRLVEKEHDAWEQAVAEKYGHLSCQDDFER